MDVPDKKTRGMLTLPARLDGVLQVPLVDLVDEPRMELLEPVRGARGFTGGEFGARFRPGVGGRTGFRGERFLRHDRRCITM